MGNKSLLLISTFMPAKSVVEAQTSTSASGRLHRGNSLAVVALLPSPFIKCPIWSVPMGYASMPTGPCGPGVLVKLLSFLSLSFLSSNFTCLQNSTELTTANIPNEIV